MIWIVVDENPWPDDYIPVFVKPKVDANEMLLKFGAIRLFDNKKDALDYANQLKEKFNSNTIRVFYPEGYSKNVTI